MGTAHKNSWVLRRCFVHTCNNIPISVLHAVLILLGRVPRCRLSFKKALERQKTQNREGADEFYCHVWALKMRTRLKNTGNRRGDRVRYIHIIIRHETQRGWGILGSCVKQRAPLGQRRQGVTLKPLPPRRSAGRSHHSGCLSASSEGLNQPVAGEK